ncbi:hypothetical protein BGZ95_009620 [Linnemannia exigua]|uniref:Uncharacterized protein n=1 Tax=Linnemannia exigua TaxID=604196 RepID=A0AAD4DCH9_9FUNG|nr:hypothetical protein BGZ95_009620 [Linnemannia exigua]
MTYFIMGGMYDPVSNGFKQDDVGFHMMMIVKIPALQVRDYKKTTKIIKEQNASAFELATVSEIKIQMSTSNRRGGIGQDWQP